MDDFVTRDYITEYLRNLTPKRSDFLLKLEEKSKLEETYAPIIEPEVAGLLEMLITLKKPVRILELGTAVGYSAIFMAGLLPENGEIITIERYEKMRNMAEENIKEAGFEGRIKVLFGEAAEILETLEDEFDIVFLDAAKGQYLEFFPQCKRLLKKDGILISDDVLFRGMIASDELVIRRKITIVKRLRKYLETLMEDKDFATTIIPLGDGVAVSVRRQ